MKGAGLELTWDTARRLRLRSMGLDKARLLDGSVDRVAAGLCGIQAQDAKAAALGVRVRSTGLTASDVDKAMYRDRSVARTWLMRETLHMVAAADLHWMLSLFGPRNAAASRKRAPGLGLSDDDAETGLKEIRRMVDKHGSVNRAEITAALKKAGIAVDPLNRIPMHLVRRAGSLGIIVEVSPKAGSQAFGPLDEWIPQPEPVDRQRALERLAERYFKAFQPTAEQDFAAWSGLPVGELRKGMENFMSDLVRVEIQGRSAWMFERDLPRAKKIAEGPLRLLPAFDALILGYKSREFAISQHDLKAVWPGGGVIRPIAIVDGRAVGTWKLVKQKGTPEVQVKPFPGAGLPQKELQVEVADVQLFLDG